MKAARSNATAADATDEAGVTASVDELVIVNAQGEDVTGKLDIEKQTGRHQDRARRVPCRDRGGLQGL